MSDLAWMRPKLAELCGLRLWKGTFHDDTRGDWVQFRPDQDVAQTVRCLEAMRARGWDWNLDHRADWAPRCHLASMTCDIWEADASICIAACLAIAAALGWEKP